MYIPQVPYVENQAIITSGRVIIHSYDDFIFLFGKKGVAISSPSTFTVDANERTILASPKIELGYQAEKNGQPVLLGRSTVQQLSSLLDAIENLSKALNKMSEKGLRYDLTVPLARYVVQHQSDLVFPLSFQIFFVYSYRLYS
jgi:hypothetical protein